MLSQSVRQGFPFLEAGQAQKELIHNEAVMIIDIVTNGAVLSADSVEPPVLRMPGQCWIVGVAASGEWAGHEGDIACWTDNGWRFVAAVDGMRVRVADRKLWAERTEGEWKIGVVEADGLWIGGRQVVGVRGSQIADPVGGGIVDTEARTAIVSILSHLRAHGLIESE